MGKKSDNRKLIKRMALGFSIVCVAVILALVFFLPKESATEITPETISEASEVELAEILKETTVEEQEEALINHPIVGKWEFYTDVNDMVNSEWTLDFDKDGTYITDSSLSTKDGIVPKKDIYAYGTFTIEETPSTDKLIYYHEVHQKKLSIEFIIESIDGVDYLMFYRSNQKPIVAARLDGEEIYEKFVRVTEE